MSHRDWEEKLQTMCSQGQKGAEGIGAQRQNAGAKKKKKEWQLYAIEQYRQRHKSHFVKEGATPPARAEVPAWSPPEQQADRDKHRDIHDDAWCLRWLKSDGSVKLPEDEVRRVRRRAARHRWDEATDEIYMITLSGKECETCQRVKTHHYAREEACLSPLEIASFMYRWSLDLAWPSRRVTRSDNSRVLIMTEHYTRFIVCVPIPNKEASTIAAAFRSHVLAVFGAPAECLVDGGKEFE
eukprot:gene34696-biopygen35680